MTTVYRNEFERGSAAWMLAAAGEELGSQVVTDNADADAMDRMTVALYRIGAALTHSLENVAFQLSQMDPGKDDR